MKKLHTLILTFAALFAFSQANAQDISDRVRIGATEISATEDLLTVRFEMEANKRAVKANETLAFLPVITDGQYKVSMKPILVRGRRVDINNKRYELAARWDREDADAEIMGNGEKITYEASVPVQLWMADSRLIFEIEESGCCSVTGEEDMLLAKGFDFPLRRGEPEYELVEVPFVPESIADTLAQSFSFIIPVSEYDPDDPFKIYDEERETALVIYFRQGRSDIDLKYMDNAQTSSNLLGAVNMILTSGNSNVRHMVVAGFASPEGSIEFNDRLAFNRAVAVKDYISRITDLDPEKMKIFNGAVDWRGLRLFTLRSDLSELEKEQVVNIVDNVPIWDSQRNTGRLEELQKLNGGSTYKYLYENIFPRLRNGAFIKVYYENQ